jgi:hypothetical protein
MSRRIEPGAQSSPEHGGGHRGRTWPTIALWVGRIGYVSRGAVYLLLAYYAARAGLDGDHIRDPDAALHALPGMLAGSALVLAMAAGLGAFAIWRLVQAVADVDGHGRSAKGIVVRTGLLASAALYGSLALTAVTVALGEPAAGSRSATAWSAEALSFPGGRLILFAAAMVLLGTGAAHFQKAAERGYRRYLGPAARRAWFTAIARTGLVARGLIFLALAGFALRAAWWADARQAKGVRELWRWLEHFEQREWICYALALGLMAFALYSVLQGVLRKPSTRTGHGDEA